MTDRSNGKPPFGLWLGLPPCADEGVALARFRQKYGREAAEVHHVPNLLLVGPGRSRRETNR